MGLNNCYCEVIQQTIWTNYHRYPIQISIRHVKTCASDLSCDFTLFLVGPFSGKQIPAPATVFYTHYFKPGAKSLIDSFSYFHPLYIFSIVKVQSSYASTLLLLLFNLIFLSII